MLWGSAGNPHSQPDGAERHLPQDGNELGAAGTCAHPDSAGDTTNTYQHLTTQTADLYCRVPLSSEVCRLCGEQAKGSPRGSRASASILGDAALGFATPPSSGQSRADGRAERQGRVQRPPLGDTYIYTTVMAAGQRSALASLHCNCGRWPRTACSHKALP